VAEYAPFWPSASGSEPGARPSWREALVVGSAGMRGAIHDAVLRRVERDLDLEELRMEA
jgi:hypothetical protein